MQTTPKQSFAFGKDKRLLNAKAFQAVFDVPAKKIHSNHLLLFVRANDGVSARLGLAITKKKVKNATDRNRLKRLARERFRLCQHKLAPVDVVLIVKSRFDEQVAIAGQIEQMFDTLTRLYPKSHEALA